MSEKYQVPAIILVDKYFTDSLYMTEKSLTAPQKIERFIARDDDLENPEEYARYALTRSGVSPRALPCMGKALVVVSGNEHSEDGHISEDISDRVNMVNKRNAKVPNMLKEMNSPKKYHGEAEILLVGWGSTEGAIKEGVDILRAEGLDAGCLNFVDLWPFPVEPAKKALNRGKKFFMVEQNSTAQLGQIIKEQTGLSHSGAILKYDGRPFYPSEIVEGVKKSDI